MGRTWTKDSGESYGDDNMKDKMHNMADAAKDKMSDVKNVAKDALAEMKKNDEKNATKKPEYTGGEYPSNMGSTAVLPGNLSDEPSDAETTDGNTEIKKADGTDVK